MEKKQENKMKPQIDIDSIILCTTIEQLGEESPDEVLCFATEEGAEAFMNGTPTYGFHFFVRFNMETGQKPRQCYRGGVSLNVSSGDKQKQKSFKAKYIPSKVWPCVKDTGKHGPETGCYIAGTYFFTEEDGKEAEDFYNYAVIGGEGRIVIEGLTVLNDDYAVCFNVEGDFRFGDDVALIDREHLRVKETEVLPTAELIEKKNNN